MTSTAVKEVGSLFANMTAAQPGRNVLGAASFQNIWNDQMSRNADASPDSNSRTGAAKKQDASTDRLQRGSSLKAKESQTVQEETQVSQESQETQEIQELSPEEQQRAMEVLGSAALQLMQEIAEAFGITMEELQAAMADLDMGQMDVLDVSKLSGLLLNLGGAEDLSALVTDGELYDTYRMLMNQLEGLLQESAETLETEPEQLLTLLQDGFQAEAPLEEGTVIRPQQPEEKAQLFREDYRSEEAQPGADTGDGQQAVQRGQETRDAQNQGQGEKQERHSEGKSQKEPQMNLFLQNLRTEQFQPGVAQAQSVATSNPWSEATQDIMNQILDYMKLQLNADSTNLEMQLHPASLGTLQIQLASKAGVVTANFIAQNETVKAALETQMIQLKEQFEEQGIRVESIEVTVQTHEFERNLDEQGRGRNNQPEKKGRGRRINLGGAVSIEDAEEEEPVADRMTAVGSTVEYTA